MTTELTLKEYLDTGKTQISVAKALNITQGAVQQMIAAGRDIRLKIDESGITAYEVRDIPSKRQASGVC